MSELQPPVEAQINGGGTGPPVALPADTPVAPPPKRQRRPSVRLGDIGDQHTYDNQRRKWKFPSKDSKSSKTRPLVNLPTTTGEFQDIGAEDKDQNMNNGNNINNNTNGLISSWKGRDGSKSKRGVPNFSSTKRVRSNWGSKMEEGDEKFDEYDHDEDDDDDSNFSMDNERDLMRSKETRVRVSSDNWNNNHPERNGVRVWLNQLGLGRYAPVFEVHEVDDEVLPLLTLEDLKDMGINAVGSRRKMFCSIQKLGKGFS